jgi:hypothetical protein
MIQIHVTSTGKGYSPKDVWRCFDEFTKNFPTLADAKAWLKETYGKAKRVPMYCDTKTGTKKIGYVIGFRNADWSHSPVEKWLQQDWVEFRHVRTINPNKALAA